MRETYRRLRQRLRSVNHPYEVATLWAQAEEIAAAEDAVLSTYKAVDDGQLD